MEASLRSTIYYRRCCTLNGEIHSVAIGRRNGEPVPLFSGEVLAPEVRRAQRRDVPSTAFLDSICHDLTARQREVFLTCLATPSYSEAARRLGIRHEAVMDFLTRMTSRNGFVRAFRENRRQNRP